MSWEWMKRRPDSRNNKKTRVDSGESKTDDSPTSIVLGWTLGLAISPSASHQDPDEDDREERKDDDLKPPDPSHRPLP
jgi:hypothetical protein